MTPQNQTKRALFLPIFLLAFFEGALLETPSNERQYDKSKALYEDGRFEA
jgi:hypothetical protein